MWSSTHGLLATAQHSAVLWWCVTWSMVHVFRLPHSQGKFPSPRAPCPPFSPRDLNSAPEARSRKRTGNWDNNSSQRFPHQKKAVGFGKRQRPLLTRPPPCIRAGACSSLIIAVAHDMWKAEPRQRKTQGLCATCHLSFLGEGEGGLIRPRAFALSGHCPKVN